jgi:predicted small secreted protein
MRDSEYVGTGITVSGIGTGDYFSVFNSNVDTTETIDSNRIDGTPIGITTSFIDCVYQVKSTYTLEKNVIGVDNTTVRRVFVNVGNISTESFSSSLITFDSSSFTLDTRTFTVYAGGISSASNMGRFSWGKIQFEGRTSPQEFNFYGNNGIIGISSSGLLSRFEPLKYRDYTS